jgi:hypothetical protein
MCWAASAMNRKRLKDTIRAVFQPAVAKHRIFFLHLPKCAGTAVCDAIVNGYRPFFAYPLYPVIRFSETAARKAQQMTGRPADALRRELLAYMMSLPHAKCIAGHFHYSKAAFDEYHPSWHFVTILRDPIDRWISHYLYNLNTKDNVYAIDMAVEDFIDTERARSLGSVMVQNLSEQSAKAARSPSVIGEAIDRLKRFSLIGCVENMPKFEEDFQAKFGQTLRIPQKNVTDPSKRKHSASIRQAYSERLAEICAPDLVLYRALIESDHIDLS